MIPDIEIKHYYNKYLEDANNDLIKFQEEYEVAINIKNDTRKFIKEQIRVINNININLSDYKQEWIIGKYNPNNDLLNKLNSKLELYNNGEERIVILQLIKYCNVLKKCNQLNTAIDLAKRRHELSYKEYRKFVANYYQYGVHKCCIEGYAYNYGYGIGDLIINKWKFTKTEHSNNTKVIDYKATNNAKKKLILEGKIPYNKEDAEIYKLRGIKYEGIPYVVYKEKNDFYEIAIINNRYINPQNLKFEHHETISANLRNKGFEQIAQECSKDEILHLKCDIRYKLIIYNCADKTAYLKYIRNVEQSKFQRGAHNSKNRQRF